MNRTRLALTAAAALFVAAVFVDSLAFGTEVLGNKEGLTCTACHDKPGSKLLTDKGKYYETVRTVAGFDELKSTFGACTNCHVAKPGSQKLTREGKRFQGLVEDMEGLRVWMEEHHPTAPPPEGDADSGATR
jgi:hypothetical protein